MLAVAMDAVYSSVMKVGLFDVRAHANVMPKLIVKFVNLKDVLVDIDTMYLYLQNLVFGLN